jgi:biotin carboxylase
VSQLLLLVESNTTGTGREFARRGVELGVQPVLITADPTRYPYVEQDQLPSVRTDTSSATDVLATARSLAGAAEIVGVTSSSEYYVATAAETAHALGLPGPSAEAVRGCRHKGVQRRRLAGAGVAVPRFALVTTEAQALAAARETGFPVVVKPVQGSGSVGVRLCRDAHEAAEHAAGLFAAAAGERGLLVAGEVLVEAYVPGREFSVELFGDEVVMTVAKHVGPLPDFVEVGHDLPAVLDPAQETLLTHCALSAVASLRLGWGAAHVELRMDGAYPLVIEVNPRLAGGMIPELIRRARGIDLIRAQVAAAIGRPVPLDAGAAAEASIRFLTAARSGRLAGVAPAISAATAVDDVVDVTVYGRTGDRVEAPADFRGRLGHVIAVSDRDGGASTAADRGLTHLQDAVVYRASAGTSGDGTAA